MEQPALRGFIARANRRPVKMRAFAMGPNRDSDVVLSDLSYTGCQIRSQDPLVVGELVELRVFKRGLIQAEIRWAKADRAGARFLV